MLWTLISLVLIFVGCRDANYALIITSGLFAIAGALGGSASILRDAITKLMNKQTSVTNVTNNTGE